MPYGFNNDKSRYDLQHDLDRISTLEAAAGFDESVITVLQQNVNSMKQNLGISDDVGGHQFYAGPDSSSNGRALWRNISGNDLPNIPVGKIPNIPTSKVTGLGHVIEFVDDWASLDSNSTDWTVIGGTEWGNNRELIGPGVYIAIACVTFPKNPNGFRRVCLSTNRLSPGNDVDWSCVTLGAPDLNIHSQIVVPAIFVPSAAKNVTVFAQQTSGITFTGMKSYVRIVRIA